MTLLSDMTQLFFQWHYLQTWHNCSSNDITSRHDTTVLKMTLPPDTTAIHPMTLPPHVTAVLKMTLSPDMTQLFIQWHHLHTWHSCSSNDITSRHDTTVLQRTLSSRHGTTVLHRTLSSRHDTTVLHRTLSSRHDTTVLHRTLSSRPVFNSCQAVVSLLLAA